MFNHFSNSSCLFSLCWISHFINSCLTVSFEPSSVFHWNQTILAVLYWLNTEDNSDVFTHLRILLTYNRLCNVTHYAACFTPYLYINEATPLLLKVLRNLKKATEINKLHLTDALLFCTFERKAFSKWFKQHSAEHIKSSSS